MFQFCECPICFEMYNTIERLPIVLDCGHTFCQSCVASGRICPRCNKIYSGKLLKNYSLSDFVSLFELKCDNHKEKLAEKIFVKNLNLVCNKCFDDVKSPSDYISINHTEPEFSNWLENEIKKMQQLTNDFSPFPFENEFKIRKLRELKEVIERIGCDSCRKEAFSYNIEKAKSLCRSCSENDKNSINISSVGIKETLSQRIAKKIGCLLRKNKEYLDSLGLKSLIAIHKQVCGNSKNTSHQSITNFCSACKKPFSETNFPWRLPCSDTHLICNNCKEEQHHLIACPVDKLVYEPNDLLKITPSLNCFECNELFDLGTHIPLNFPCGICICNSCIKSNYLSRTQKCSYCSQSHQNFHSLEFNSYVIKLLKKDIIYCTLHRNRASRFLDVNNLEAYCNECKTHYIGKELSPIDSGKNIFQVKFSSEIYAIERKNKNLSLQGKLDRLQNEIFGISNEILRSKIPKGRTLLGKNCEGLKFSYLDRFWTVFPPKIFSPKYFGIVKPWKSDREKGQIESVSFKCNKALKIHGVGIGKPYGDVDSKVNYIRIKRKLDGSENLCLEEQSFKGKGIVQNFLFSEALSTEENEVYQIDVKISANRLFRGNPFDYREEQIGSDGCVFRFFESEQRNNVNGQNEFNGPILRLLYLR